MLILGPALPSCASVDRRPIPSRYGACWRRPQGLRWAQLLPEALCAPQMLAAKAYDLHNAELQGTGLTINTPETMWNVPLAEAGPIKC